MEIKPPSQSFFALIFIFLCLNITAQTGPGGVGDNAGANGPRNVLWLDASTLGVANGANVTTWTDQSGNGNNLTQQGGDPVPTFAENAFGAGLDAVRFDGTERYLRIADNATLDGFSGGVSIIIVTDFSTVDNSPRGILSKRVSSSSEEAYSIFTYTSSRLNFDVRTTGDNRLADGTTLATGTDYILSSVHDASNQFISVNGSNPSIRAAAGGVSDATSDLILGALNNNYGTYFDGDLAEVIIYGDGLTQAERIIVENYLANKYGITISNDLWTDNATYSNDITGIGQESIYSSEATSGKSSLIRIEESTDFDNNDWLMIGHDDGSIAAWSSTEVPGSEQRLAREWLVEETNDVGKVTVSIQNSELPATGFAIPNYYLLVDTDGDADFSNAGRFAMTPNAVGATATVTLNSNDRIAIAFEGGDVSQVWYSYSSGNWNDPNTWTLDGAVSPLYNNPSSEIPSNADSVVIQTGRTVTMNVNNAAVTRLEIIGTLDLAATTGHTFGILDGSGTMRLSGAASAENYPTTNDALFIDATEGGTLEYYGTGLTISNARSANNLVINSTSSTDIITLLADMTINGNMTISNGIFQFNDNSSTTSRNVTLYGDLLVQGNGSIDVGTANARHEFNLHGDFTNQGDVDFTNRNSQVTSSEATDGIVDVNFVSATQDQKVNLQNTTDFYRLEINKGVDDTYVVDINATAAANFNLYGYANSSTNSSQGTTNDNALGLIYGTVKVGNNVTISPLNAGGNYSIYAGSQIWVNGGTVEKTGGTAIVPYGKIRVSSGVLNAPINSGITTRDNGQLTIEGGTVTVNQFRTSINGVTALGGLVMTGGIFNVTGGNTSTNYYTFSLTYPGNVFNMSGGVINLSGVNTKGGIYINSSEANVSVTGGTVNLDVTNNNDLSVTSNAPFFNMNVLESSASNGRVILESGSSGTGAGETTITMTSFEVLNDLRINNAGGNGTTFNAGGVDLDITGSLTIDNGSSVDFSNMKLTMKGAGSSAFNIGLASTLVLDSLEFNKSDEFSNINIINGQSTALQIDELFNVVRGNFELGAYDVVVNGSLTIADTIGAPGSTGLLTMSGGTAQTILSTNGFIHDLQLNNTNGVSLSGDIILDSLHLDNGLFNIASSKVTLNSEVQTSNMSGFSNTLMLQTGGNASDGGLEYYFDGNTADPSIILYPFGSNSKYTPARLDLTAISDDGHVQINPVDSDLLTTELTGGNILSYYWRVRNSNFSTLPNVTTLAFDANAADDPTGGPLTSFVPGGVEDGVDSDDSPTTDTNFNRFYENNGITGLTIEFDGEFSTGSSSPFQLRSANYTAGVTGRFPDSSPDIYYTTTVGWIDWSDQSKWSLTNTGADDGNTGVPGAGDIAVIKSYGNGNGNHWVDVDSDITVAQVIFDNSLGGWSPRFRVTDRTANLDLGPVSGTGQIQLLVRTGEVANFTGTTDLGDFSSQPNSQFNFNINADNQVVDMPSNITVYPQLRIEAGNGVGDDDNRILQTSVPITVNSWVQLDRSPRFRINHDVTVKGDVRVTWQQNRTTIEIGDDRQVTFDISGDLLMRDGTGDDAARFVVKNDNQNGYEHVVRVRGNIDFESGLAAGSSFDLYNGTSPNNNAILELSGTGSYSFTNNAPGVLTPDLYRVVMNAGTDTTNSFTFNNDFTLNGDNTASPSPLELQNGKLILNSSSTNLTIANGVDYTIPASAGLEVAQGTIATTGSNIILDGLLRVNGGTVNLGTSDIEYSTTGSALVNVTSGTLNVGGQVRRSTTSTAGVLKYRQSGGDVDIATDGASTSSRAAFEVLNNGSEFTLTGGTFNIARGVAGDANVSLELNPTTQNVTGSTITIFEGLGSNYGSNFFNLAVNIPLNNLTISNNADLPDIQLFNQSLEVNNLTINTNQTLLAGNFNLTLNGNFTNNGTYTNNSTETNFAGSGSQFIDGTGTNTVFTLRKSGSGTTTSNINLSIGNDFYLDAGTFDVQANSLSLQNDAYIRSTFSNTGGNGLVFNGTANQDLNGQSNTTVDIGTITINNASGVDITDGNGYNFNITQELRLNGGVFNIGGSLVTMKPGAPVTAVSPFNVNNMVQTNSSFTDNGLRIEFFTVSADTVVFFPIGELKYTPVQFNLNAGTTAGGIRVRPANERHPTITNNTEPMTETEIDDIQNVLQYHWIVVAENLTNASGSATFSYDHADIQVTAPYDTTNYISARLLSNNVNWDKFAPTQFLGGNRTFSVPLSTFSAAEITGDYTAGVGSSDGTNNNIEGAIPDQLAQYETSISGSGNYSAAGSWTPVSGSPAVTNGVGPVGAQVIVKNGDQLTLDISNIRLYATEIESGGTLIVPSGVTNIRLGNVSGSGTIVLQDNELLPTGEYSSFLACDGGGLQYSGSTSYSVLSGISQIRKVIFDGTGIRDMPNNALSVCDTLIVNGPTVAFDAGVTYTLGDADTDLLQIHSGAVTISNASTLNVTGDFQMSGGSLTGLTGTTVEITDDVSYTGGTLNWNGTTVILDGSTEQLISGPFTGASSYDNLTINNASANGVTVNSGSVEVDGVLTLTDGFVNTTSTQLITLTSSGSWTGASPASFVTGPIRKNNLAVTSNFEFPVGKPARYAPITVVGVGAGGQDWTGEYFTTLDIYPGSSYDNSDPGSGFNALTGIQSSDRWQVESSGSNSAQLRAAYGSHNGHSDQSVLRLVAWDPVDSRWENEGGQVSGSFSSGTVTSENTVSFSIRQFSLGISGSVTTPVELMSFEGEQEASSIYLRWSTAIELNNDYFLLFRSTDGVNFEEIGYIKGNGTTEFQTDYFFNDIAPVDGDNYYYLEQFDFDGKSERLPIIAVAFEAPQHPLNLEVYPNPATTDNINLFVETGDAYEPVWIEIIDMIGQRVMFKEMQMGGQQERVNLNSQGLSIKPGAYVVRMGQKNAQIVSQRLLVRP